MMEREKQRKAAAKFSLATRGWPKVALTLTSIMIRGYKKLCLCAFF